MIQGVSEQIIYRNIDDLQLWAANYRESDVGAIITSIRRFGFNGALCVWNEEVRAGNHTLKALRDMQRQQEDAPRGIMTNGAGAWVVPCIDISHLSDIEASAFAIAHNRTTELANNDEQILAALLSEIALTDNLLLEATGYDGDWLDEQLQADGVEDPGAQIDRADELREKWQTGRGQIWQVGRHRVMCGDSTDAGDVAALGIVPTIDAVITDPPYGMRLDTDFSAMRTNDKFVRDKGAHGGRKYKPVENDDADFDAAMVLGIGDIKEQFWFGADYYARSLGDTEHSGAWLVWDKRVDANFDKMYGSCFELIWSRVKRRRVILRHVWAGIFGIEHEPQRGRNHPTQKPTPLLAELVGFVDGEGSVYDPFLGSGTTLAACEQTGRAGYGMEIDPAYVAVTLERLSDMGLGIKQVKV